MSEVRKGSSRNTENENKRCIIKMLIISKNLVWPRDLESFKGGNFNTLSLVDCYVQISTQNSSSSRSLVQMRANTHVSSSVSDVVDILDVNYDDLN
jgi:hypothetical protein